MLSPEMRRLISRKGSSVSAERDENWRQRQCTLQVQGPFVVCVKDCVWKIIKIKSYATFIPGSKEKAGCSIV